MLPRGCASGARARITWRDESFDPISDADVYTKPVSWSSPVSHLHCAGHTVPRCGPGWPKREGQRQHAWHAAVQDPHMARHVQEGDGLLTGEPRTDVGNRSTADGAGRRAG